MEFTPDAITQSIFENVFAFFGVLTSEGFVLSLSGKVFDRTSTNPNLLIGQKFSETAYWQSSEHTSNLLENAIIESAKGKKSNILLDFRVNSQEKISIELFLQPLAQNANEYKQIFFCAQEVTERERQIEYYKTRSEHLLYAAENAGIGLWYWDLAEEKINSTPKCNELLEVPAHEIITLQSFLDIVHPEDRSGLETTIHESQTNGKEFSAEYRVIYSDGNIQWIGIRGKTYLDNQGYPENMMGIMRLITDKKVANEELSKVYAREKKARDEAEEANRAKDFFLAVVSHELRSPLNAILGWSKILLTKKVDAETTQNALETIEKSARSQAKLIEDLVDSARVSSGKMRLELRPVNLYDIIKTVFNSQKPAAETKQITLNYIPDKENIQVFGDAMRLQQVFTNLVSNALKFTDEGGSIEIKVKTKKTKVKVIVADDGQGINSETLPDIFSQFRQGDGKTLGDRSGLGLGLSIAKILVEKHSGKILAASEGVGQGSQFTVVLPLCGTSNYAAAEVTNSVSTEEKLLQDCKILIVEDDPDSREVLQLLLEQSGAKVASAASSYEAMDLLREAANDLPSVIVSDLAMPDEDGYALINRIRKLPAEKGGEIPALALSAFASNDNKQKAFDAGFQKYHTKPFEPDGIIQDILQLLNK